MFMKGANTSLSLSLPGPLTNKCTWNKKENETECDRAMIKYEYQ